jgi:hypothetical protein
MPALSAALARSRTSECARSRAHLRLGLTRPRGERDRRTRAVAQE